MKVLPFEIPKPHSLSLIYQEDKGKQFYERYHQHREIQLSLIISGVGTMIVGDSVTPYKAGDIVVFGSQLPHVLRAETGSDVSFMKSLFFNVDSFGADFFQLEELKPIRPFFRRAPNGFIVQSNLSQLRPLFNELTAQSNFQRFINLLEILRILSKSKYQSLSSFRPKKQITDDEGKRISEVMSYSINNYHKNITLAEVAGVASMTKNAFCKYFKKRTNKTYFQFLNELRIERASKLLLSHSEMSIAEIAEQCGFRNISNFNRQFKSFKKMTPSQIVKMK